MKNCCDEYCSTHGCNQGRNCPARITPVGEECQWLNEALFAVAMVFAASCIGYLLGGRA